MIPLPFPVVERASGIVTLAAAAAAGVAVVAPVAGAALVAVRELGVVAVASLQHPSLPPNRPPPKYWSLD